MIGIFFPGLEVLMFVGYWGIYAPISSQSITINIDETIAIANIWQPRNIHSVTDLDLQYLAIKT